MRVLCRQIYMCDYCTAMRNKLERMLEHLQFEHTTQPQTYTHAYDKYRDVVDARMGPTNQQATTAVATGDTTTVATTVATTAGDVSASRQRRRRSSAASSVDNNNKAIHVKTEKVDVKKATTTPPTTTTKDTSFACTVCKTTLKNQADFDWHLTDVHPQYVRYQCGHCDHLSEDKTALKEHMISVHSDKPPEYSMVRNLPPNLDPAKVAAAAAAAANTAAAVKECKMCAFVTQSTALLNQHLETQHLSQVLFQCRLCSGLHKTKDDLMTHYGVLHKNNSLQYKVVPLGAEDDDDDDSDDEEEVDAGDAAVEEQAGMT